MKHVTLLFILGLALMQPTRAEERGVINDPDGFTNVRAGAATDSAIVAKVKAGEVFTFEHRGAEFAEWVKVTLGSGKTGWMHASRVRFHAVPADIKDGGPDDEVNLYARRKGLDYYPMARAATKGEPAAMRSFFAMQGDGAAAETHWVMVGTVMHLLGDEKLALFFTGKPAQMRADFRTALAQGNTFWPFEPAGYMKRNFPRTAKILDMR